ncbi:MAG TPA: ABC transporter ATP-binding protein [Candidatus Binatia bacterium]|nr:ABC transporter ATP-binding protein [Candidatus Binatia bacterium]
MAAPIVEVDGVALEYPSRDGPVPALRDVTLAVGEGDFVCVVGPSGCGKTSLLRIVAGFVTPTRGRVSLDGRPIGGPDHQRGVVFQQPTLYPWLSVEDNVAFGPRMRGVPAGERRALVERYLRLVGLWEFRRRATWELSGGQQQRVAIARVLANDPRILLMDEPFGALDALTREHLQDELLKLWRATGKTVFFITHSVEEACYLGTHVVVMSSRPGRILATLEVPFSRTAAHGGSRAVKSHPEFVATREEVLSHIWAAAS